MKEQLNILMVASENDGLQGAKVGGIGDVARDVPPALADLTEIDCRVTVIIPSYGFLHELPGAEKLRRFDFPFAGAKEAITLYQVPGKKPHAKVRQLVLHHPRFTFLDPLTKKPRIYCDDPSEAPFATDATKFARFCSAVDQGLRNGAFDDSDRFPKINRLHLHDWHAAFLLILRRFEKKFDPRNALRTVYTIHNLALQGIRPLRGHPSSLEAWYPHLQLKPDEETQVSDPDYRDCVNPMAVGIRFSDAVHVVSPGYKEEILLPSIPSRGNPDCVSYGGEGLEEDLKKADGKKCLFGILNGCDYDQKAMPPRSLSAYKKLLTLLRRTVKAWAANAPTPVHDLAIQRLEDLRRNLIRRPGAVLTCVTRLASQKARLMRLPLAAPALERTLQGLDVTDVFILLSAGDKSLEQFMHELSSRYPRFVFLNGFDDSCAKALYENGDLFLMPSSFEPCGISQMLAMRAGQPCVVHCVGGLKDTIKDGRTGFSFSGPSPDIQANRFVETVFRALDLLRRDPVRYDEIRKAAFGERFLWRDSALKYVEALY